MGFVNCWTMYRFNMRPETDFLRVPRLAQDPDGCLFDERARELVGAGEGAPGLEAIAAVRTAARHLQRIQERWAESHGLSEGRLQLLFKLSRFSEGVSLGHLAELQNVSPRNITGLVDRLEEAGLVERVPDPADRRSIQARLTEAGRARLESIRQPALQQQSPLTDGFTREELAQLRHLALKLLGNAQRLTKD
jgi:DNA-binding MarR family transcriptional regulator